MIRNEITLDHYHAAMHSIGARGEKPTIGAVRAELKRQGFSDRDLRLQGFSFDALQREARVEAARAVVETAAREEIEKAIESAPIENVDAEAIRDSSMRRARAYTFAAVVVLVLILGGSAWLAR